ncbi:MAG: ATP-binding protein [Chloroflexota bacterium]
MANIATQNSPTRRDDMSSQTWWQFLTRPANTLNAEERERASALAALSLVFIFLAIISVFVGPIIDLLDGDGFSLPPLETIASFPLLGLSYVLSRTQHFTLGAYISSLTPVVAVIFIALTSTGAVSTDTLFFIALGIVISGLVLDTRGTFIVSIIAVAGLILSHVYASEATTAFPTAPAILIVITGIFITFVNRIREQNMEQLRQTQSELLRSRDELATLNQTLENRVAERTAELKEARDDALASQRIAQENSRLKSEFLSTMSHELRTPLNAIEGFTSIMLSGMGIELSPRAEDMTRRVSSNSKRLLHLINDFLDLSRIEAGRLELTKEPISPEKLAYEWKDEVSVLADEKGLDFSINIAPDLPETIMGDEDALSKIGINLLGNAFKFTHEGSVSLTLKPSDNGWEMAVTDTGIGIPLHAQEYIFDEFRQVDGSSKRLYGGTGLGLALVQKLARAMGGRVSLQSEVDKGSTFTVWLPLQVVQDDSKGVSE